jgi:hypothetical protein
LNLRPSYICKTCGVQHAESGQTPKQRLICEDGRQYIGWDGQQWTTLEEMKAAGCRNNISHQEPGLTGIGITPQLFHRAVGPLGTYPALQTDLDKFAARICEALAD